MAYETKVILRSLANQVVLAKTKKQVYELVRSMAQVEGMTLPSYEDMQAEMNVDEKEA